MLVPWLLGRGHHVTVYDAMLFGKRAEKHDNEHERIIQGDIRSVVDMYAACEGQDAVICLAGIISEEMCQRAPLDSRTINMGGAMVVAVAASNAGVKRFIYASSVAAYPSSDKPSTEETVMQPSTIYGECKVAAEERVLRAIPNSVLVRSASVCGYSTNMRFHVTVNRMMRDAMVGDFIMVNGGDQWRSRDRGGRDRREDHSRTGHRQPLIHGRRHQGQRGARIHAEAHRARRGAVPESAF
jgi:nucleoside-diphosphate-sugar epimerase